MNKAYEQLVENYRATFGSPSGRDVLEDLEKAFHVHHTTFKNGMPEEMIFNEGERSVVLYIKGLMEYKPITQEEEDDNG